MHFHSVSGLRLQPASLERRGALGVGRRTLPYATTDIVPFVVLAVLIVVVQDLVVEMIRGYHAFGIHGKELPNPSAFYANAAAPESLVKNALNVIVAVISDIIMVSSVWDRVPR